MNNVAFDENDLKTEIYIPEEPKTTDEYVAMLSSPPIRVTHLPTGISAIGEGQVAKSRTKKRL